MLLSDSKSNPNNTPLDPIDQHVIDLLRLDGRMAFTEIAKRLNIPEATARYRVQRLLQSGVIKVLAWPNPEKLGMPHFLIVSLNAESGKVDEVAETLAQLDEVRFVAITTGRFNIVVDIYFGTHEDLLAFFDKLHRVDGIIHYESQITLKLLKAEYKYTLV
ncbi:MAG: Lrp/AsnC family transcriptional regulator [Elainellaceae cyanobacterium]